MSRTGNTALQTVNKTGRSLPTTTSYGPRIRAERQINGNYRISMRSVIGLSVVSDVHCWRLKNTGTTQAYAAMAEPVRSPERRRSVRLSTEARSNDNDNLSRLMPRPFCGTVCYSTTVCFVVVIDAPKITLLRATTRLEMDPGWATQRTGMGWVAVATG